MTFRIAPTLAVCGFFLTVSAFAQQALDHTATGVQASSGARTLRVDALRPDVLRVRLFPLGQPKEDASWAVLEAARTAHAAVTSTGDGFTTSALRVIVGPDLRLKVTDLAGNVLQEDAAPVSFDGAGFKVSKQKSPEDHFFGLGDKPGPLDRAGQSFVMWNTDNFGWQESTDPIYKSIPFFLDMHSGRALGVLFDNTFRSYFDFGHERTDRYAFSAPDGPLDYYLLYGPEPKQVIETYAWLTGPTPLPPMWALGYQQSRYSYTPRARVEEVAAKLRADHIPADVIWLDIDYQYRNRPFTVDPETFPDFPGLIHKLTAENFQTVVITDLHIAEQPGQGYAPYDSGKAGDHFVKRGGKDYVGPVWPGPSVFPDFTRKATRDWWGTLYKQFVADGVAGFWNDMNEPAVFSYPTKTMPDDVEHRIEEPGFQSRTALHTEIHNLYGMENTRATWDGQLALRPNLRPFVMTRASYAGGQRYAATWTGDNSSTWNHLRQTTPQLLNLGLSGFSLAGADVGGFAGSPSPALLTRWLMLAAFQPIDRDHAAKGTRDHEPWVDGPEEEAIRRRYIEERYRLMPYLYTTAEETSRDGLPIVRPLFLEFPHAAADGRPLDLDASGEFLFGSSILVAASPSPEEVAPYEVHLPPGVWYDYWTGAKLDRRAPVEARDLEIRDAKATALKPVMANPGPADLPVYVRGGAILPMAPVVQSTGERPSGALTLRVFPGEDCQGSIYQDDGKSYDFRKGAYFRQRFTCAQSADGAVTVSLSTPEGSYSPWWHQVRIEVVGLDRPATTATSNGKNILIETTTLGQATTIASSSKAQSITLR
ncbi:alpha-glucosidase [Granulicella rosea]|uniref:Alpha-glucosidase n=1 Tax=Granulicella rosea TaxID=474952 RepID=A0A239MJ97_9BACT|nr:TIM-barrel domain-containing protein [Granulicella rosea]SNT42786.1 alpha-glucosidase [Granulicella rosea]